MASPHSNAFVDINGDCLSDLVVVTQDTNNQVLEIFINTPGPNFVASDTVPLPIGAGQISWADIGFLFFVYSRYSSFPLLFPPLQIEMELWTLLSPSVTLNQPVPQQMPFILVITRNYKCVRASQGVAMIA